MYNLFVRNISKIKYKTEINIIVIIMQTFAVGSIGRADIRQKQEDSYATHDISFYKRHYIMCLHTTLYYVHG